MNEYLSVSARYNRGANRKLVAALATMASTDPAAFDQDRGSYYKSLHGLFNHVVGGEIYLLKLIAKTLPDHHALAFPELAVPMAPGVPAFPDFPEAAKALEALDTAYIALATESDEVLATMIAVHDATRRLGDLLVSAMAHAAHHRGQVSQVLDELKIDNDFYAAMREI